MKTLNCESFKEMIVSAANNLENNYVEIDKLNVFPVPDGDTGTNMKMTFVSGVNDTVNYLNDYVGDTAKYLSKRMLMGARGNSGVILSQLFKGFANALVSLQTVDIIQFANGLANGAKIAYKAVMRPVEGTILTVAREVSEAAVKYASENPDSDFRDFFDNIVAAGETSLLKTPELLPVLKEVGVVDSGGAGYMCILKGMQSYLNGNPVALVSQEEKLQAQQSGYCVEISVDLNQLYQFEFKVEKLTKSLGRTCTDIKIKRVNNTVLIHAHTVNPGEIVSTAQRFGIMNTVKIQNLASEVTEILNFEDEAEEMKKYGLITVCTGEGVKQLFNNYGVEYVINGGQTMNPATKDFVELIDKINAENIIILPNNSNIILAANQAKDIVEGKKVVVLPTKSIPQGIAACINFNIEDTLENNLSNMQEGINSIKSGSVTTAIKDTTVNGIQINKDDFMGISEKEIVTSSNDLMTTCKNLVDQMIAGQDCCFITIIYGDTVDEDLANEVLNYAIDSYDIEGEIVNGQQPLYQFIFGLE